MGCFCSLTPPASSVQLTEGRHGAPSHTNGKSRGVPQIRDLNSGTFGFVELALDKASGQQVAIKVWKLCSGPLCSAFSWAFSGRAARAPLQSREVVLTGVCSCAAVHRAGREGEAWARAWGPASSPVERALPACFLLLGAVLWRRAPVHMATPTPQHGAEPSWMRAQVTKYVEREILNHRFLMHPQCAPGSCTCVTHALQSTNFHQCTARVSTAWSTSLRLILGVAGAQHCTI